MKKNIRIIAIMLLVVLGGVGFFLISNTTKRSDYSLISQENAETTKTLSKLDYEEKLNNSCFKKPQKYEFELNCSAKEMADNYVEKFTNSLENFTTNDSYLYYQDIKDGIPSMEAYVPELGYIKGMRESSCGNDEYSSWVYTINNEYFSRIILSTKKIGDYKLSPSNSNYYYKSETFISQNGEIMVPDFALVEGEIQTNYKKFEKEELNIEVNVPNFDESFQYFEGNFVGLDSDSIYLTGISKSNYNRKSFSSKNVEEALVTDFCNFWLIRNSNSESYLLNGSLAELQLKKLFVMIFDKTPSICENFEALKRNPKEICSSLDSYYSVDSIQTQFFEFDINYVTEEYYQENNLSSYDKENSGIFGMTKAEYDNASNKPFVKVYEYNKWRRSVISFSPVLSNTKVIEISE